MKKSLAALAALFFLVAAPSYASAHAGLVSSNPVDASELTQMPSEITLNFTDQLMTFSDKQVNTVSLSLQGGDQVALGEVRVEGATLSAVIPAGTYQSGIYEISYRIVSADGHKVSEILTFSLNLPEEAAGLEPRAEESDQGQGVIPLPLVAAIAILLLLGGFFALRNRRA